VKGKIISMAKFVYEVVIKQNNVPVMEVKFNEEAVAQFLMNQLYQLLPKDE
jgi:BioD-like phosphotransacetylase family protein